MYTLLLGGQGASSAEFSVTLQVAPSQAQSHSILTPTHLWLTIAM